LNSRYPEPPTIRAEFNIGRNPHHLNDTGLPMSSQMIIILLKEWLTSIPLAHFPEGDRWKPSESSIRCIRWKLLCVAGFFSGFQQNPVEIAKLLAFGKRGKRTGWRPPDSTGIVCSAVAVAISQYRPVPMSRLLPPCLSL
jgi:hypothetical protein